MSGVCNTDADANKRYTGYVANSHLKQSDMKRVLKMLLSEPLASLITFSGRV